MNKNRKRPDTKRITKTDRIWLDVDDKLNARLHATAKRHNLTRDEAIRKALDEFCRRYEAAINEISMDFNSNPIVSPREINQRPDPRPDPLEEIQRTSKQLGAILDAAERHLCR